jgi:ribonuclease J
LLQAFLKEKAIPLSIHHVTGHAYPKDLQRLAQAIGAERVVPIHSLGTARFHEHFPNVEKRSDNEWWEV